MDCYYHVTTPSAWEKIQQSGLIPLIGKRSQKVHEPIPAVFLFESRSSLEDAYWAWLSEEFEEEAELLILSVTPPKGLVLDEGVSCDGEVRCYDTIPPACITLLGSDDDIFD